MLLVLLWWINKGEAPSITNNSIMFTPEITFGSVNDGSIDKEPYLNILSENSKIIYSRGENVLCCRDLELSYKKLGDKIYIYENWSGIGCKCLAFADIKVTLDNVPDGNYELLVYETGTDSYDDTTPINNLLKKEFITIEN